jgi:hypothetical protein
MERAELITHLRRLIGGIHANRDPISIYAEALEFLRNYAGPQSSYVKTLERYDPRRMGSADEATRQLLESFLKYVEAGLHADVSPERRAQLDVVSDFLEMANALLNTKGVHPAAPAMIIGATLEEFLRTWVEAQNLSMGNRNPGLEAYSQVLREADLITKQDGKDITAWAGVRNHAAHGEWDEVSDKNRIALMFEGVNLFLRKYAA